MAGTNPGARFYRQIKRHPAVSSVPRATVLIPNSLASLAAPKSLSTLSLAQFPSAPGLSPACPQSIPAICPASLESTWDPLAVGRGRRSLEMWCGRFQVLSPRQEGVPDPG